MTQMDFGWVTRVQAQPPSLQDNTGDADRLAQQLKAKFKADAVEIGLPLLKTLPGLLREGDYALRCLCFKDPGVWRLVGVKTLHDPFFFFGLAVDLGTTRVVMRLINLETGAAAAETAFDNPQIAIGPDILERIHFTATGEGLARMQSLIIDSLNRQIVQICRGVGLSARDVHLLSVSGNTSMTHLFLGLPSQHLIREPYIPAVNALGTVAARDIGIACAEAARVYLFPNVGSYFGGDLISGIVYSGMHRKEEISMLVDVGTNAEVVLGNRDWLVACAGAAGPALEGGVSNIGTLAGPGVIDRVEINPHTREIHLNTIDDLPPRGICGSGMIDLMAQLFLSGMVDIRGKFAPEVCGDRLREKDGLRWIVLVNPAASATGRELAISQADIDSLIRSKAAMYTILSTITRYVGVSFQDLARFYVAGTFGSFINPRSAITIGMIPDLPDSTYQILGNSSLGGAALVLTSRTALQEAAAIRDRITYLELNVNQEFMNRFSAAKFLPHTDPNLFPSVRRQWVA